MQAGSTNSLNYSITFSRWLTFIYEQWSLPENMLPDPEKLIYWGETTAEEQNVDIYILFLVVMLLVWFEKVAEVAQTSWLWKRQS